MRPEAERKEVLRELVTQLLASADSLDKLLKLGSTFVDPEEVASDLAECYSMIEVAAGNLESWAPGQASIDWEMDFLGGDCPKDGCDHCDYRLDCLARENVP